MPRHVIALFGLGRAGHIHFRNLLNNHRVTLKYVVELDKEKASATVKEHNAEDNIQILSPSEAHIVYEDKEVEAVIVTTPTNTHQEIVMASLKHNKGVFCEKPLASDAAGTLACYEAAESVGKPLLCSFNRRFDPSLRTVYGRIQNGEAGKLHMIKSTARDSPLPPMEYLKISGNFFHDCGVHDFDLVSWILGEYPTSVYVQATAHNPEIEAMDDVDCVAIVLKFKSGIIGIIDLDRDAQYGYDQRLEVFGSTGMVVSDFQKPTSVVRYDKDGEHSDMIKFSFPERYAESYVNALDHFIDVIEGKGECEITKYNTMIIARIADACDKSHKTGIPATVDLVL